MIDMIFRIETVNKDNSMLQKLTLLSLLHIGIFVSQDNGNHLSFSIGFGPLEFEWSVRLWLTQTK